MVRKIKYMAMNTHRTRTLLALRRASMRFPPVLPAEGQRIARERALDRLVASVAALGGWQPCDVSEATRARLLSQWDSMAITVDDLQAMAESWGDGRPDTINAAMAQLMEGAWL